LRVAVLAAGALGGLVQVAVGLRTLFAAGAVGRLGAEAGVNAAVIGGAVVLVALVELALAAAGVAAAVLAPGRPATSGWALLAVGLVSIFFSRLAAVCFIVSGLLALVGRAELESAPRGGKWPSGSSASEGGRG